MAEERELESDEEETPGERSAAVHVVPMTPGLGEILSRRPGEMQVARIPVMPAMVKPGIPRVSARPLGEGIARPEGEERAFEPPEAMKASALKEGAERVGKQTKQLDYRVQDDASFASSSEKPANLPTTLGQLLSVAAPGALDPGASIGSSWPKAPSAPQMQGASTASGAQLGAAADQAKQASDAISGSGSFVSGVGAGLSAGKGDSGEASGSASAMFGSGGDFSDASAGSGAGGEGSRAETNASMGLGKALSGLTGTAAQAATLGGQTPF
jgi:hypothetical protein